MTLTTLRNFAPLPLQVRRSPIDVETIKKALTEDASANLLDCLDSFGAVMVTEIASRGTFLETKALGVLGWAAALLAFLSVRWKDASALELLPLLVSGALSTGAVLLAFDALRVRKWPWPCQRDWFRTELFSDPTALRVFHLIALLRMHEAHSEVCSEKARALDRGQWCLLAAALSITLTLVVEVFS